MEVDGGAPGEWRQQPGCGEYQAQGRFEGEDQLHQQVMIYEYENPLLVDMIKCITLYTSFKNKSIIRIKWTYLIVYSLFLYHYKFILNKNL